MNGPYRLICLFAVLTSAFAACAQQQGGSGDFIDHNIAAALSPRIKNITDTIAKKNQLLGPAISYSGDRPEQYDYFDTLRQIATPAELTALTGHPNGVVRCYAFWALTGDPSASLLPVIIKHLHDTAIVTVQFGCIIDRQKVADFFIETATAGMDTDSHTLNAREQFTLDSLLIVTPNRLYSTTNALFQIKPAPALYQRIRQLATQPGYPEALVALAKYRNEADTALLLQPGHKGNYEIFSAVQHFPHPAFFRFLTEEQQQNFKTIDLRVSINLYHAIAAYKNDEALRLMQLPLQRMRDPNHGKIQALAIYDAVQNSRFPLYDTLLWQIWEERHRITPGVFPYLYAKDPQRALTLAKRTLRDPALQEAGKHGFDDEQGDVLSIMLDTVLQHDRPAAIGLIRQNLTPGDYAYRFPAYIQKATQVLDTTFARPLLKVLEKEGNPHSFLPVTKALLAYGNMSVNIQIATIRKKNRALNTDWGGEEFTKLLAAYGIR